MTEEGKREFFQLVVEKETTRCWSWIGEYNADGRPIFRGEKAYRVMYELRVRQVPAGFHVHHKCGNSACVNPRHLVALSAEAHRAVHATKDKAIKERIYRGEWEQIQAAEAETARLARERFERQRLECERIEKEQEEKRQLIAEAERWRSEHPWLELWQRCKWFSGGLICAALTYLLWKWTWSSAGGWGLFVAGTFWIMLPFAVGTVACFMNAFTDKAPVPPKKK